VVTPACAKKVTCKAPFGIYFCGLAAASRLVNARLFVHGRAQSFRVLACGHVPN